MTVVTTWNCAGCERRLGVMDIALIGPGTLKWCKACEAKSGVLIKILHGKFESGELTLQEILKLTKDVSEGRREAL